MLESKEPQNIEMLIGFWGFYAFKQSIRVLPSCLDQIF